MDYRLHTPLGRHDHGFSVLELLFVLTVFGILVAIAVPATQSSVGGYALAGSGRAVAYQISLTKMRAASTSARTRLHASLNGGTYWIESYNSASTTWTMQGGVERLPQGVAFGYGSTSSPPPNTQTTIGQSGQCMDTTGTLVANTACIMFNSRGIPIDTLGTPVATNALYITDGGAVYGATVAATGMTQLWWTPTRTVAWQKQQ